MKSSSRAYAFLALLLSLPGALFVLLTQRNDAFARHFARQSLALFAGVVILPLAWAICSWVLAFTIPTIGSVMGVVLFALLLAAYAGLILAWIIGLVCALQGRVFFIPMVGQWPAGLIHLTHRRESTADMLERARPSDA